MDFKTYIRDVPWRNMEEFLKVHDYAYSDELTKMRWAVDRIVVWKTRHSIPVAIDATVGILRAMIQDRLLQCGSLAIEPDIHSLYCSEIARFVNLSVNVVKKKKRIPVMDVAKRQGIPEWIVDLQQKITHTSLKPSLCLLRTAAVEAMRYLEKSFWEPESTSLENYTPVHILKKDIVLAISKYMAFQYSNLRDKALTEWQKEEFHAILNEISNIIKRDSALFIQVFVKSGLFIPTYDQLKSFQKVMEVDEDFVENKDYLNVPEDLVHFWILIIIELHNQDAISDLVEVLLLTQDERDQLGQRLALSWVYRILYAGLYLMPETSTLSRLFSKAGVFFAWDRLLYACVKHPFELTPFVFSLIQPNVSISQEKLGELMTRIAVYLGMAVDENSAISDKTGHIYSVEDVDRFVKKMEPTQNIAFLCSQDVDLSGVPIGTYISTKQLSP